MSFGGVHTHAQGLDLKTLTGHIRGKAHPPAGNLKV